MSISILTNLAGFTASSIDACGLTAGTASGYSVNDFINGPRSTRHRTSSSSSEIGRGYVFAANTTCSYIYISRADWLITQNGTRVRPMTRNSGGTWAVLAGSDYNPIAASDLIGARSQDLVFAVTPVDLRGIGISTKPVSGSQGTQISKFWGCESFDMGVPPSLQLNWETVPEYEYTTPLNGTMPYEIERRYSLTFENVTRAKATAFKALSHVFQWPILLYDPSQDLWSHKLEHVIIESYTETIAQSNVHTIALNVARLKQYD